MKIVTIVGARPQFVKAGIVSLALKKYPSIEEVLIHTGQHFDANMSDIFFRQLEIPQPKYNLNINSLGHGAMTGRMLESVEEILLKEKPDYCMVYGDTNSTLAGALAAKKLHIKVIHIEAGLRSYNMRMPEEVNRILTDRISDLLFCPTTVAVKNLEDEGFKAFDSQVHHSGDVMEDAALYFYQKSVQLDIKPQYPDRSYILVTVHRAENTDDPERLGGIVSALNQLAAHTEVVLPIHPRTKAIFKKLNLKLNFEPIEPVGYLQMLQLIKNSSLVLTDSGGLQKEAFFFRKYCITLRDETEWSELVENGYNFIAGADTGVITSLAGQYLNKKVVDPPNLYGNGRAADFIVECIRLK